jgi:hypothetical protein
MDGRGLGEAGRDPHEEQGGPGAADEKIHDGAAGVQDRRAIDGQARHDRLDPVVPHGPEDARAHVHGHTGQGHGMDIGRRRLQHGMLQQLFAPLHP